MQKRCKTFPSLQAAFPDRNTGRYYSLPQQQNTANINAVYTAANEEQNCGRKESADRKISESAHSQESFVNKQREATAA